MAYDTKKLEKEALEAGQTPVSLGHAEVIYDRKSRYKSERDFVLAFLPKVEKLIKDIYGLDVEAIEKEKQFDYTDAGYYKFRPDVWATTKQGKHILIECKNPTHEVTESITAISQLMRYKMVLDATPYDVIYILATSRFFFYMAEFIHHFSLPFDFVCSNKKGTAFLLHTDFK